MYIYIYCIYAYLSEKFKLSINVHACMYVCMYGEITNKQGIE